MEDAHYPGTITFRCPPELKAKMQVAAKADDRTLSKWLVRELTKVIEQAEQGRGEGGG